MALLMAACAPQGVDEACRVVAEADSLWQAGQTYDDSLRLAQAYETLSPFNNPLLSTFHPKRSTDYAHACYHYGKLLRAKDDPVAAMQCFINASHSRTHDYHILGRIYSNMSDLCHLASEFPLAYDMYERSGEMYLRNGDTLLYYYDLNNMAYELAEQSRKEETLEMLSKIESQCPDKYVLAKVQETKAEMYLKCQQNDSAIYWAHQSLAIDDTNPTCVLIKAQAFSRLEMNDSALFYANIVLNNPYASKQNIFNALYYTSHLDSTLSSKDVCTLTSQREDIRYYEYEPQMKKLKDAVRLLQQTLMHKPNLTWLYTLLGTLLAGAVLISWYISRKHKKHELLSQQIDDLETGYADLRKNRTTQIEHICATLRSSDSLSEDLNWKNFNQLCIFVNEHFYLLASKLQQKKILNETEIRLCVLVLIGLTRSDIANILPYALNSVGKLKDHTAKKLGTTGKNLHDFLLQMAVEG
jgi:tetratricopeptide (TPR) repeat protein